MAKDTKEITIPFGAGVGVKDLVIARERAAGWILEDQKSILILKFVREAPEATQPTEPSDVDLVNAVFNEMCRCGHQYWRHAIPGYSGCDTTGCECKKFVPATIPPTVDCSHPECPLCDGIEVECIHKPPVKQEH